MSIPLREVTFRRKVERAQLGEVASSNSVPPDPERLVEALRQIGYSFEQALSDLVDNAISADARNILIRFIHDRKEIRELAIVDDGIGMTDKELENAMRFGSERRDTVLSLGRFGMGLKLASFSHARTLTVATRKGTRVSGRRWTLDGIKNDWSCHQISNKDAQRLHGAPWSPIEPDNSGTAVIWESIDKLPLSDSGLRHTLRHLHRRLDLHLGLHFHRFLESGRIRIFIDQQVLGESEKQIRATVQALNPFAYPHSGDPGYPKIFTVSIPDIGQLDIEGHVWPPNSEEPEYRLGGKAAARQGFYFYRNDRLIQAGGWNGLVQSETEPHSSLTRVRIDLPPELDSAFSLNVQKSSVIATPGFGEAVRTARCKELTTFDHYRYVAEQVYRNSDERAHKLKTAIPRAGVPDDLRKTLLSARNLEDDATRPVDFKWVSLNEDELFRLDREGSCILLNDYYRYEVLAGLKARKDDVPLFKMFIFHLLEQDLKKTRTSSARSKELGRINQVLIEAVNRAAG